MATKKASRGGAGRGQGRKQEVVNPQQKTFYLPERLIAKLDKRRRAEKTSASKICAAALEQYLK